MEEKPKPNDDTGEKPVENGSENWDMTPNIDNELESPNTEEEPIQEQPVEEQPVEKIDANDATGPAAKAMAEQIVDRVLPDGTVFHGTIEEWKDEMDAWRDRTGAA